MVKILVVEDETNLNRLLCRFLNEHGYEAEGVCSGKEAVEAMYVKHRDMLISDIMMPGMDGFALARTVREENADIPILFLSARDDFTAKEKGYGIGIDDYLVKPVEFEELLLHVRALLRRAKIMAEQKIQVGNLVIDEQSTEVRVDGKTIDLTLREFQILDKLLSNPGRTFTRSQLLDDYSGLEKETSIRTVDVHITNLRAKLAGCDGFVIKTVRGLGYKVQILDPKEGA